MKAGGSWTIRFGVVTWLVVGVEVRDVEVIGDVDVTLLVICVWLPFCWLLGGGAMITVWVSVSSQSSPPRTESMATGVGKYIMSPLSISCGRSVFSLGLGNADLGLDLVLV